MKTFRYLFAASAAIVVLSACGGGGDGEAPPPAGGPAPAAPVAISSGNQTAVARSTLGGGLGLGNARVLAAQPRPSAQAARHGSAAQVARPLVTVTQRAISIAVRRSAGSDGRPRALAVISETEPCTVSGSITLALDDRDNNEDLSAGDVLTITFNQCRDSADDLVNGTVVVSITSVTETSTQLQFAGTMTYQSLTAVFGQASATANGTLSVAFLEATTLSRLTLSVGSSGLTLTIAQPGYSDTVSYQPGMQIQATWTASPAATTVALNGSFGATSLGGTVTVSTLLAVRQLAADAYPSSGQLLVVGANNTRLRITVLSNTTVRLELDADGNGAFESVSEVAWSALLPA